MMCVAGGGTAERAAGAVGAAPGGGGAAGAAVACRVAAPPNHRKKVLRECIMCGVCLIVPNHRPLGSERAHSYCHSHCLAGRSCSKSWTSQSTCHLRRQNSAWPPSSHRHTCVSSASVASIPRKLESCSATLRVMSYCPHAERTPARSLRKCSLARGYSMLTASGGHRARLNTDARGSS